jgi:hypothetical protein
MIVQQPMDQTVNVGDTVTFTVVIEGSPAPFGYRWRRNNLPVLITTSSSRTFNLVLEDIRLSQAGRYDVVITNAASPPQGLLSQRAELTVVEP